jgi:hypothetical protein
MIRSRAPCRLVRILSPIVQALVLTMFELKTHRRPHRAIGTKLVRDHDARRRDRQFVEPPHEPLRRAAVSSTLNNDVENQAIQIGGAPEPTLLAADQDDDLASRPGEFHPQALPEPYVKLSLHTAPDAQPPTNVLRSGLLPGLLPLPVGPDSRLSNAAPLVQSHYRTFTPTTGRSAPVPRIGTLVLSVFADWTSPFASGRQVLTFHTKALSGFAPPICRVSLGQASEPPPNWSREMDAPSVSTSSLAFRHVISGSLSLASPDRT